MDIKLIALSTGFFTLLLLGLLLFIAIHYISLQKLLKAKFPFEHFRLKHLEWLKSHNPKNFAKLSSHYNISDFRKHTSGIVYNKALFSGLILFGILSLLEHFIKFLGIAPKKTFFYYSVDISLISYFQQIFLFQLLIFTCTLTAMLLIFSQKYFDKPLKETAKASIIAGIVSFSVAALYIYLLFKALEHFIK